MHGNIRTLQNRQKFLLTLVMPFQQPVECDKTGFCSKNAVKTPPQLVFSLKRWIVAIFLDVGVKPPDAVLDALFGPALLAECVQLVHQPLANPLAMDPAQGVIAHPELASAVGNDDRASLLAGPKP